MPRRKTIGRNPLAAVAVAPNGSAAQQAPSGPGSAAPEPSWPTDSADPRQVIELWAGAAETTLRATFDTYTALLATSLAAADTTAASERALLRYWGALTRQVQEVALASVAVSRFWPAPR